MQSIVAGIFADSEKAGEAVAELKQAGYTDHISLVARDEKGDVSSHGIKENTADGAAAGAVTGGVIGGVAGLIAGAVTAALPGAVLLIAGPLAAFWGVTGAALGALSGGILGALVDAGFPEETAKAYEDRIMRGEVLVTVEGDNDKAEEMENMMAEHGAVEIASVPKK